MTPEVYELVSTSTNIVGIILLAGLLILGVIAARGRARVLLVLGLVVLLLNSMVGVGFDRIWSQIINSGFDAYVAWSILAVVNGVLHGVGLVLLVAAAIVGSRGHKPLAVTGYPANGSYAPTTMNPAAPQFHQPVAGHYPPQGEYPAQGQYPPQR